MYIPIYYVYIINIRNYLRMSQLMTFFLLLSKCEKNSFSFSSFNIENSVIIILFLLNWFNLAQYIISLYDNCDIIERYYSQV